MSRRDLEIAIEAFRAANAQPRPDFETVNRLFDSDHVFSSLLSGVGMGELRGGEGFREFLREAEETVSLSWTSEIEGAVDLGPGKVLLVCSIRWHTSGSTSESDTRAWVVATINRAGKVSRTEVYPDPGQALEAAGRTE